jgi:hypothetical protein
MLQGWHHQGFIPQIDPGGIICGEGDSSGAATTFQHANSIIADNCPDAAQYPARPQFRLVARLLHSV